MRNEARLDITSGFRLNHNQSALEHGCLGTVVELVRHGFRALGGSVVSTNDRCGVLATRLGAYYGNRLQLYALVCTSVPVVRLTGSVRDSRNSCTCRVQRSAQ
jgi:hypothetical protein